MYEIQPDDENLDGLRRAFIPSGTQRGVAYRITRRIGQGGMAVVMLSERSSDAGTSPAVLKILKPEFVLDAGDDARLVFQKEATSLHQLNQRVPPSPHVVQLLDHGEIEVRFKGRPVLLGWLGLEHVHGGAEGTTLEQRVKRSIERTKSAFDPLRAADAIRCIGRGLSAVHSVGVIHRDVKPNNVLCTGFGAQELMKIADFGLARPAGIAATFGGAVVGTLGYAPPEQLLGDMAGTRPSSDVFGFAAVIFHLLTGDEYFTISSVGQGIRVIQMPARRRIADGTRVCPAIKQNPAACEIIDRALARATDLDPAVRQQTPDELTTQVLEALYSLPALQSTTVNRLPQANRTQGQRWSWQWRHRPWPDRVVESASWSAEGRCLATTTHGLAYWNGTDWRHDIAPGEIGFRGVERQSASSWLVTRGNKLYRYGEDGLREVAGAGVSSLQFERASGSLDDLLVLAGSSSGNCSLTGLGPSGWLRTVPLPDVAAINSLTRLSPTSWLVAGRLRSNVGLIARYRPLDGVLTPLSVPHTGAFFHASADVERGTFVVVGTDGWLVFDNGDQLGSERLSIQPSSAIIDTDGTFWIGGAGAVLRRLPDTPAISESAWQASDAAPTVGMLADSGLVLCVTADGAVLEGHVREPESA